jgi:hypothetical protein
MTLTMRKLRPDKRVLAIDVRASKFSFVVFDGPDRLLDWGQRNFRRGVNAVRFSAMVKIARLLDEYSPDVVVLKERPNGGRSDLRKGTLWQAKSRHIPVRTVPWNLVKATLAGDGRNKYRVASAVASRYPELASRLPAERKIWESEAYQSSLFDAAALGIAYFSQQRTRKLSSEASEFPLSRTLPTASL